MKRPWLLNIGRCYLCGHVLEWSIGWGTKNWGWSGPWFVHIYPTLRNCHEPEPCSRCNHLDMWHHTTDGWHRYCECRFDGCKCK